jgi:hypothetical protein
MRGPIEPRTRLWGRVAARVIRFENDIEGEGIQWTDSDHIIIVNSDNDGEQLTPTIELSPSNHSLSRRNSQDVVLEIHPQDRNSQIIGREEGGLSESPPTSEAPSRLVRMILVGSTIALTGVYLGGMYANLNSEFVRNHHIELIVSHTTLFLGCSGCLGYLGYLQSKESRDNDEHHQTSSESPTTVFAELVHVHHHPNALPAGTNNSDIVVARNNSTEILTPVTVESLFTPLEKSKSLEI